ncbi:MAG: hypothetical protein IPP66_04100 [Anaerolineales bacterium]|nr:hypothetical protein [Anaerolineales bacterium]
MNTKNILHRRIRILLVFFMCALAVSGLTAIPLQWELKIMMSFFENGTVLSSIFPALTNWLKYINEGVQNGYGQYPFLAYGTDWLAFGHVAIAIAFLGVFRDPVKNIWVVEFGMLTCLLIIPWALIFGYIRNIPFFWQMIDMSFGVFGIVPLWFIRRDINRLSAEG